MRALLGAVARLGIFQGSLELGHFPLAADEDAAYVAVEMGIYHACRVRESVELGLEEYYAEGKGMPSGNSITYALMLST